MSIKLLASKDAFFAGVDKDTKPGCWLWTRRVGNHGYGVVHIGNQKTTGAHRVAWSLINGEIPKGGFICHKCDVPRCVNPDHLYLGNAQTNMLDVAHRGRAFRRRLNEDIVRAVRAAPKENLRVLAERYGVGRTAICNIRSGYTWWWVDGLFDKPIYKRPKKAKARV